MNNNFLKLNHIKFDHIKYGFFTRLIENSNSDSDYNLNTKKNINKALNLLNLKNKEIKLVKQVHSNIIAQINKKNIKLDIEADGLITNDHSIGIGILTADCAPIFIFDKSKNFICCLHAGWKGALMNIASSAINLIINKYNKNLDDIFVIIGPCLEKKNFEVDLEFKNNFIKIDQNYNDFFSSLNKYKNKFDMRGLINSQFNNLGIKNIFNISENTYQNKHLFFSHRRAIHSNLLKTGRMVNIICFE